jgi:hypothetical protein
MRHLASLLGALLSAGLLPGPSNAATLDVVGGQLVGAFDVNVGGTLYDVEFVDGTCVAFYSGCDELSDFTFQTQATADMASQALLDQVFLDGGLGNFDTDPTLTSGCTDPSQCDVITPYEMFTSTFVSQSKASNSLSVDDSVDISITDQNLDTTPLGFRTMAVWSAVPVPGTPYYLRSTVGPPWGVLTNELAMDAVFGAGNWVDERYETVDTTALFAERRVIFMEGGFNNADEMEAFLDANAFQIANFMSLGGVALFNSAPLEGNGMGYPDAAGGQSIALNFPDFSFNPIAAPDPGHPIFNGPFPTTTSFTGVDFAHGSVTGAGLTSLLDDPIARSVLAERPIGDGLALYGAMTTTNFHLPQPDADNLRANILAYAESAVYLPEPSAASGLLAGIIALACAQHRRKRRSPVP